MEKSTKKKLYFASVLVLFTGIMIFGLVPVYTASYAVPAVAEEDAPVAAEPVAAFAGEGSNDMSDANLLPGDIICIGTDNTMFDWLIPGKWSHTVIFGGTAGYHEIWATEEHTWVPSGETWVIHSTKSDDGDGLRTSRFSTVVNDHADNVVAMRVLKPGGAYMTSTERNAIVNFAYSKLGQDEGYDWNWLGKQVGIDSIWPAPKGYYCSELAWAAYKSVLGIDLDGDFSPFNIGVSPEDLYWSQYCSVIALEMNSDPNGNSVPGGAYAVDASNNLYRVRVYIDEVYYDNDHDPWPSGNGEMYIKLWIGEAYFPSCGATGDLNDNHIDKIDDANDDYTSKGTGALDWNTQHFALVSYNSYAKVRVQASEYDPTSGDDDYPTFQWWWSPSSWHGYINNGWYWSGSRYDMGDCRYTIWFRIDSCY